MVDILFDCVIANCSPLIQSQHRMLCCNIFLSEHPKVNIMKCIRMIQLNNKEAYLTLEVEKTHRSKYEQEHHINSYRLMYPCKIPEGTKRASYIDYNLCVNSGDGCNFLIFEERYMLRLHRNYVWKLCKKLRGLQKDETKKHLIATNLLCKDAWELIYEFL